MKFINFGSESDFIRKETNFRKEETTAIKWSLPSMDFRPPRYPPLWGPMWPALLLQGQGVLDSSRNLLRKLLVPSWITG